MKVLENIWGYYVSLLIGVQTTRRRAKLERKKAKRNQTIATRRRWPNSREFAVTSWNATNLGFRCGGRVCQIMSVIIFMFSTAAFVAKVAKPESWIYEFAICGLLFCVGNKLSLLSYSRRIYRSDKYDDVYYHPYHRFAPDMKRCGGKFCHWAVRVFVIAHIVVTVLSLTSLALTVAIAPAWLWWSALVSVIIFVTIFTTYMVRSWQQ